MKNFDWDNDEIRPGDRIKLHWYGDRTIPKTLAYTEATVLSFHITRYRVQADGDAYGTRNIDAAKHVFAVLRNGEWLRYREGGMRLMDMVEERTGCRGNCEYVIYRATVVDADKAYSLIDACRHKHRSPREARRCARRLLRENEASQ